MTAGGAMSKVIALTGVATHGITMTKADVVYEHSHRKYVSIEYRTLVARWKAKEITGKAQVNASPRHAADDVCIALRRLSRVVWPASALAPAVMSVPGSGHYGRATAVTGWTPLKRNITRTAMEAIIMERR
jgi:hypothetical protein